MRDRQFSSMKTIYVLTLSCLALVSTLGLRTQNTEASNNRSIKFAAQSQTTAATNRGRYNGKIVFTSDRQNDGGRKLWTMNPDGSNQTQLTFESDRGPGLPDYIPVNDVAPKWSPDGTKIAFISMRDFDPQNPALSNCSIYIMDYQSHKVQRLKLSARYHRETRWHHH